MLPNVNHEDFTSTRVDEQLLVRFFHKGRQDAAATKAEGRPIFREVEYVEIRVPGQRDVQACRPATYADKQRFPLHYEKFKQRIEAPVDGTPLAEWPHISRSQAEELSFMNVKTVEQLANLNDNFASRLHGGHSLKRRAGEWLQEADTTKLIAEKAALEKRLADMEAKMNDLLAAKTPEPASVESKLDEPAPATSRRSRRKETS